MKKNEIQILEPSFFKDFSCIGPACSDNCCHSWELAIDKAHYLQYKSERNPEFKELCNHYIKRCYNGSSPERFAILALKEDGRCGFQDEDGGCRMIRLLGPDSLSTTCALYPRRKAQFSPNVWEFSLSLSCATAAQLALFSQEQLEICSYTKEIDPSHPLDRIPPLGVGRNGVFSPPPAYGSVLRRTCMSLVSCRQYQLKERILAVGLLLKRVDRMIASGAATRISEFCQQFLFSVERGDFADFFGHLEYLPKAHRAAMQLPAAHLLAGARQPVLEHLKDVLIPWCEVNPVTGEYQAGERAMDFLIENAVKKGDPLLNSLEIPAENYFLNYMFSGLFPFLYLSEGLTFEQNGILLAEQFALLRLLLSLGDKEQSSKEQMVQAVVALSRLCQHADLGKDLSTLSRTLQLDGLAHAAYLLR